MNRLFPNRFRLSPLASAFRLIPRRWWVNLGVAGAGVGCLYGMRFGEGAAVGLGLIAPRDSHVLMIGFAAGAMLLLAYLAARLVHGMAAGALRLRGLHRAQSGVVLSELVLVTPILIITGATIFQVLFILNASMVVRYAAYSAARAAIVSLHRNGFQIPEGFDADAQASVNDAAVLVCCCISPPGEASGPVDPGSVRDPRQPGGPPGGQQGQQPGGQTDPLALMLQLLMSDIGGPYDARTVSLRVRYARAATHITMSHALPPSHAMFFTAPGLHPPREVTISLTHDFYLTLSSATLLPGMSPIEFLPGMTIPAPAGLPGRALPLHATITLQSAGARVHSSRALSGMTPPRP